MEPQSFRGVRIPAGESLVRSGVACRVALALALAAWLAGCGSLTGVNNPINRPITGSAADAFAAGRTAPPDESDDVLVGLAFSGGGTRAAAFSFGVLAEVDRTRITSRSGTRSLLNRVDFVSGVSGGSVLTAYYGLKKRAALDDFRERFLLRNAEEAITTDITPVNLVKAFGGGVNDSTQFSKWLNANLFDDATFADFRRIAGPAGLDQRLRHLQPHLVHLRRGGLYRAVQRSSGVSDCECGCGLGRGAGRVRAGCDQDLSEGMHRQASTLGGEGAAQPERRADAEELRQRAHALQRRLHELRQAYGRRACRQFRAVRLHHCSAHLRDAVRTVLAAAGGPAAPRRSTSWSTPDAARPATGTRPWKARAASN